MPTPLARQVARVLRDPDFAPVALALFLHGLGQGITVPVLALWLTRAYGHGAAGVAAYFSAAALGGLALNPLLGRATDRLGRRRGTAALAACSQAAGLAVLACRPPFAVVVAAAATLLAVQVQPHLFALVDDHLGDGGAGRPRALSMATLRAMISAAWMVGAPLGGLLAGRGFVLAFSCGAAMNAGAAVVALVLCRDAPARARPGGVAGPAGTPEVRPRWGALGVFGLAVAAATAGNAAKLQAMPLYLARLGLPVAAVGATYGWMALGEMLLMPPVGRLADRLPRRWVVSLGTAGGAAFFLAVAAVPGPLAVVVAFPAASLLIAALYGVGIGYAQDLDPRNAGLAGGVFFAAQGVGNAAGGPLIAATEGLWGLPRAFLVPAAAILLAAAGILATRPAREQASIRLAPRFAGVRSADRR